MSIDEQESVKSLNNYGKSFQEKVVQALLIDSNFAEQLVEVFDVNYFDLKYLQFLADKYFSYCKKYKTFPTLQLLLSIVRDELAVGNDTLVRDQIIDFFRRIKTNPDIGDLPYVKEKTLDFCRKQALKSALSSAVDKIHAEKYELIVDDIKKAVMVGTSPSLGHIFFEDYETRFTILSRNPIPTAHQLLNQKKILNGGLGGGELGVVVAAPGVGKSHFLIDIGQHALSVGKNVVHYSLELLETAVAIRYDSAICDIDSNQIIEKKDEVIKFYNEAKGFGKLVVKEFPTGAMSTQTIRSHLQRLQLSGFRPDIIVVDYADIMRSVRKYESLRHELKAVYEELRALAIELKVPIWTASQSNKEGANSDIIDLTNMSEAYGKAHIADFVISLSRKAVEKATGLGRAFIAKNRAGIDGLMFNIKIDTARSKFEFVSQSLEDEILSSGADAGDELKRALRSKWNELKADPILGSAQKLNHV